VGGGTARSKECPWNSLNGRETLGRTRRKSAMGNKKEKRKGGMEKAEAGNEL